MPAYTLIEGDPVQRKAVRSWLHGLDRVGSKTQEAIITAWVTAWVASPYEAIEAFPYSAAAPFYGLSKHVNDVTRIGIDLAHRASADWGVTLDDEVLIPILILHDVDKPLMFVRNGEVVAHSPLSRELPHGVVGAMILKDLGFVDPIISTVAVHAANAPFHGSNFEAMVLHYADYFATDYVFRQTTSRPFYQRHWQ